MAKVILNDHQASNQKHYEMAFTPAEFSKTLQGQYLSAIDCYQCKTLSSSHWGIIVKCDENQGQNFRVALIIEEASPRNIAMLKLPVLYVCFSFDKANAEQQGVFLKRFFKYFHKGGG